MQKSVLYQKFFCSGEEYRRTCKIGYCGETKTMLEWLKVALPGYSDEEIELRYSKSTAYFLTDYILNSLGKRLVAV